MTSSIVPALQDTTTAMPRPGVSTKPAAAANSLDRWPSHVPALITGFASVQHTAERKIQRRLAELGFLAGETVQVVARSGGRNGPLAVRVGHSTFALRMHEAALLQVDDATRVPA